MFKKPLAILLCLCILLSLVTVTAFANNAVAQIAGSDTTYHSLQAAVNAAKNGDTIKLCGDVALDSVIEITDKSVTIDGQNYKITFGNAYTETLFSIGNSGGLTLMNVAVDGGAEWTYADSPKYVQGSEWYKNAINVSENGKVLTKQTFVVNDGGLTLGTGTTVQNFVYDTGENNYNSDCGIISALNGGKVVLNGVTIKSVAGTIAVVTNGELELSGTSVIERNLGYGHKGGMFIVNGGTAEMKDTASIKNNITWTRSGGIFGIINGAEFTMNGGEITGNKVIGGSNTSGSMICVESSGKMVMNGGSITNNIGKRAGAISSRWTTGKNGTDNGIYLNGGTISGNTTTSNDWGGASVFVRSTLVIGEDMTVGGSVTIDSDGKLDNKGTIDGSLIVKDASISATSSGNVTGSVTASVGKLKVTGGTYGADVKDYIPEGYEEVQSEGKYFVLPTQATVTFKVVNGTWADDTTDDKTVIVKLTKGKGTLSNEDVPKGMKANDGYEKGSWNVNPVTTKNGITGDTIYTYTFAEYAPDSAYATVIFTVGSDSTVIMMPAQDTAAFDTALDTYKLQLMAGDTGFSDVAKTDWFYSDVTSLATKGVVSGYPDGTFLPYGEVTWGEALKLVLKASGFGDIAATGDHWASGYMDKAIELGYISGAVDLNAAITRGEMADLCAAAMKLGDATFASPFADDAPASAVALYEAGIIKGSADNGQLLYRADSTITRAEISAIIWRMVKAR